MGFFVRLFKRTPYAQLTTLLLYPPWYINEHADRHGAVFFVDATHAAGVLPLDVQRVDPDFVVFPTYKWLLGPYGRAFLYVAQRRQDGVPLEQIAAARRGGQRRSSNLYARHALFGWRPPL